MIKIWKRIIVGLIMGIIFAAGSYAINGVVITHSALAFESGLLLGFMFIGPLIASVGGVFGFLLGANLNDLYYFATTRNQSDKVNGLMTAFGVLALFWVGILLSVFFISAIDILFLTMVMILFAWLFALLLLITEGI